MDIRSINQISINQSLLSETEGPFELAHAKIQRAIRSGERLEACIELINLLKNGPNKDQLLMLCSHYETLIDDKGLEPTKKDELFREITPLLKSFSPLEPSCQAKLIEYIYGFIRFKETTKEQQTIILRELFAMSEDKALTHTICQTLLKILKDLDLVKTEIKPFLTSAANASETTTWKQRLQILKEAAQPALGEGFLILRTAILETINSTLPAGEKARQLNAITSELFPANDELPFPRHLENCLAAFRNDFEEVFNRQFPLGGKVDPFKVKQFQKEYSAKFTTFFQQFIALPFLLLNHRKIKTEFHVVGSLAREEMFPYSDFEGFVLFEPPEREDYDPSNRVPFLTKTVEYLNILMISLGETDLLPKELRPLISHRLFDGLSFDRLFPKPPKVLENYNSSFPILLATRDALMQLQEESSRELEDERLILFSMAKSKRIAVTHEADFDYAGELSRTFHSNASREKIALQIIETVLIPHYRRVFGVEGIDGWEEKPFQLQESIDIKDHFLKPLYHALTTLSLYHGIEATNTLDIIEQLASSPSQVFTSSSATLLQEAVAAIYLIRTRAHFFFKNNPTATSYDRVTWNAQERDCYKLEEEERAMLEKAYSLVIRPLYNCLGQNLIKNINLESFALEKLVLQSGTADRAGPLVPIDPASKIIAPIFQTAQLIYQQVNEAKFNKSQCGRMSERVRLLCDHLRGLEIYKKPNAAKYVPALNTCLAKVRKCQILIYKHTEWKNVFAFISAKSIKSNFQDLNREFYEEIQKLGLGINIANIFKPEDDVADRDSDRQALLKMVDQIYAKEQAIHADVKLIHAQGKDQTGQLKQLHQQSERLRQELQGFESKRDKERGMLVSKLDKFSVSQQALQSSLQGLKADGGGHRRQLQQLQQQVQEAERELREFDEKNESRKKALLSELQGVYSGLRAQGVTHGHQLEQIERLLLNQGLALSEQVHTQGIALGGQLHDQRIELGEQLHRIGLNADYRAEINSEALASLKFAITRQYEEQKTHAQQGDFLLGQLYLQQGHGDLKMQAQLEELRALLKSQQGQKKREIPDELKISFHHLVVQEFIKEGAFGKIYKGELYGEPVAIKQVKMSRADPEIRKRFVREVKVMDQLRSQYITRLCGVVDEEERQYLVMEYMEGGSLDRYLANQVRPLDIRHKIVCQIVQGLRYMHMQQIFHRDLRLENVLIDGNGCAKLADFGLVKVKKTVSGVHTVVHGTESYVSAYLSPERLKVKIKKLPHHVINEGDDIYSLGVLMWALMTNQKPYQNKTDEELIGMVLAGYREPIPTYVPDFYRELISACWHQDPEERPTLIDILRQVKRYSPPTVDTLFEEGLKQENRKNYPEAFKHYEQAAMYGSMKGRTNLAVLLFQGKGVKKNVRKAEHLFVKSAMEGHLRAIQNLVMLYKEGCEPIQADQKKAQFYLKKAAEKEDPEALEELKRMTLKPKESDGGKPHKIAVKRSPKDVGST